MERKVKQVDNSIESYLKWCEKENKNPCDQRSVAEYEKVRQGEVQHG